MRIPRSLHLLPLTILAILLTPLAHADFQAGVDAYDRKDYATAFKEWQPLAEEGDALAQYNLGVMYANGQGVPQDYIQASMWVNLAAAQGQEEAVKGREILTKGVTSNQIAEAQRLAREWQTQHQK
jgi:TPR repeat protein